MADSTSRAQAQYRPPEFIFVDVWSEQARKLMVAHRKRQYTSSMWTIRDHVNRLTRTTIESATIDVLRKSDGTGRRTFVRSVDFALSLGILEKEPGRKDRVRYRLLLLPEWQQRYEAEFKENERKKPVPTVGTPAPVKGVPTVVDQVCQQLPIGCANTVAEQNPIGPSKESKCGGAPPKESTKWIAAVLEPQESIESYMLRSWGHMDYGWKPEDERPFAKALGFDDATFNNKVVRYTQTKIKTQGGFQSWLISDAPKGKLKPHAAPAPKPRHGDRRKRTDGCWEIYCNRLTDADAYDRAVSAQGWGGFTDEHGGRWFKEHRRTPSPDKQAA
jgi:hypothetical protein